MYSEAYAVAVDSFERDELRERPPVTEPVEPPHEHADPLADVASLVGNRAFGSLLARDGAGIMPGGVVHPEIETAIAGTRGGGVQLEPSTRERLGAGLGDNLDDVRMHTGAVANGLARAVSARAFATGTDVYFAAGEYRPGSAAGDHLLAHEVSHVVQQRGADTTGPMTVTEPGDALEVQADAAARGLSG
jgi:Domain of unknown function (DUF4157)